MENTAFTLAPPAPLPAQILDRALTTDLAADFTLPDYLPEIRRLLRVTPAVMPDQRYLGAASAEFSGVLNLAVTYAGPDGSLWSTNLPQDYTVTLPIDADLLAHGLDPTAETTVDSIVSRVTAPRKLNIRARLRTTVRAWGDEPVEPTIEGNPPHLERLNRAAKAMQIRRASSEPIDLGDEINLVDPTGTRVIRADGCVNVTSATVGDGAINCRGELILRIMTCQEADGMASEPTTVTRKLPFETQIPMPDASPDMTARVWGRCGDLAVAIEDNRLVCDATVWLEAEVASTVDLDLTADAFATDGELADVAYRDIEIATLGKCGNSNFTLNGAISCKDTGLDPAAEIVDATALPQIDAIEASGDRCTMSGTCRVSLICRLGDEYSATETSIPFKHTLDCGELAPTDFAANLTVTGLRHRIEGDGDSRRINLDADVAAAIRLFAKQTARILDRATYTPTASTGGAGYTICYPEQGESLWSICRRNHANCARVATANGIDRAFAHDDEAALAGIGYLLI